MPFRDVVGQGHATLLLRSAVRADRRAHAYLFVGPAGTGRRTLALAFAQLLNCQQPTEDDACGACRACRRIAAGNHPDVRLLDIAEGQFLVAVGREYRGREIPIDQIRALQRDASYPPYEGRAKVYIIVDAELLSPGAANSLLKVLEEPPPDVVLILIAETTAPLPATIISRCQIVRCALVPTAQIAQALRERYGMPPERARVLASLAAGRMGRALAWARSPEALARRDRLLDRLVQVEEATLPARLDAAEELAREREVLGEMLEIAALWYRDLAVWKESQDPGLLVNLDRREEIARWAGLLSWEALGRRIAAVEAARDSLERNVHPRLLLESLFCRLTLVSGFPSPRGADPGGAAASGPPGSAGRRPAGRSRESR